MGNSSSYRDDGNVDEYDKFDGIETLGYRVLGVQPNSPASVAGLVSFFDFLVGVDGKMLLGSGEHLAEGEEYDDVDLPSLLQEKKGQPIELCECCCWHFFSLVRFGAFHAAADWRVRCRPCRVCD